MLELLELDGAALVFVVLPVTGRELREKAQVQ